jgi:light-harvesting complex II chlorophyll a/b binding protein 7
LGVVLVQKFGSNASLLFSALPVVLLTCVSKSDLGDGLREQARKAKEADEGGTEGGREGRERMRALAKAKFPMYFGKERGRWMPRKSVSFFSGGDSDDDASSSFMFPSYLDGTLAGDAQFDPLRLSDTEEKRRRNVELELLHGRWAMLAVVGVCVPEILSRSGALELSEPIWWKIGEKVLEGIDVNYLGIEGFHIAGASGIIGIAFCQAVLMGGPEYARYVGIESLEPVGVYLPGDTNYPGGGPFDPFNLSADAERDVELRVSEVKHGRLAMIAMLGVFAQAFVTREGPVANVLEFF